MCLHNDLRDNVHEMLQVFKKHEYVRPHFHPKKTETKIILEGKLLLVIYDVDGKKLDQFVMSREQNSIFNCRLDKNVIHTNIPLTDVVFYEIISGPYLGNEDSVFPEWTYPNEDRQNVKSYMDDLLKIWV